MCKLFHYFTYTFRVKNIKKYTDRCESEEVEVKVNKEFVIIYISHNNGLVTRLLSVLTQLGCCFFLLLFFFKGLFVRFFAKSLVTRVEIEVINYAHSL